MTPIVNYAGGSGNVWDHQIAINLGNLRDESAWRQNPIVIFTALVVCSGLTSWTLEIVHTGWYVIIHQSRWIVAVELTQRPEKSIYYATEYPN